MSAIFYFEESDKPKRQFKLKIADVNSDLLGEKFNCDPVTILLEGGVTGIVASNDGTFDDLEAGQNYLIEKPRAQEIPATMCTFSWNGNIKTVNPGLLQKNVIAAIHSLDERGMKLFDADGNEIELGEQYMFIAGKTYYLTGHKDDRVDSENSAVVVLSKPECWSITKEAKNERDSIKITLCQQTEIHKAWIKGNLSAHNVGSYRLDLKENAKQNLVARLEEAGVKDPVIDDIFSVMIILRTYFGRNLANIRVHIGSVARICTEIPFELIRLIQTAIQPIKNTKQSRKTVLAECYKTIDDFVENGESKLSEAIKASENFINIVDIFISAITNSKSANNLTLGTIQNKLKEIRDRKIEIEKEEFRIQADLNDQEEKLRLLNEESDNSATKYEIDKDNTWWIFRHSSNKMSELQAQRRALRIGNKIILDIFPTYDEFEEHRKQVLPQFVEMDSFPTNYTLANKLRDYGAKMAMVHTIDDYNQLRDLREDLISCVHIENSQQWHFVQQTRSADILADIKNNIEDYKSGLNKLKDEKLKVNVNKQTLDSDMSALSADERKELSIIESLNDFVTSLQDCDTYYRNLLTVLRDQQSTFKISTKSSLSRLFKTLGKNTNSAGGLPNKLKAWLMDSYRSIYLCNNSRNMLLLMHKTSSIYDALAMDCAAKALTNGEAEMPNFDIKSFVETELTNMQEEAVQELFDKSQGKPLYIVEQKAETNEEDTEREEDEGSDNSDEKSVEDSTEQLGTELSLTTIDSE